MVIAYGSKNFDFSHNTMIIYFKNTIGLGYLVKLKNQTQIRRKSCLNGSTSPQTDFNNQPHKFIWCPCKWDCV